MGLDRPALRRTAGLRFWRLLGTGRGATMTMSADLRRWALFAVWEDEAALDAFLASSPVAARWEELARERWHVRLECLRSKGAWGGSDPLAGARVPNGADAPAAAAAETSRKARRPRRRPTTAPSRSSPARRSGPPASCASTARSSRRRRSSASSPGLLASLGVGEWPLARQATFSLWRSLADARAYAYASPQHMRGRAPHARRGLVLRGALRALRPYGSTGTWNGADPLEPWRMAD